MMTNPLTPQIRGKINKDHPSWFGSILPWLGKGSLGGYGDLTRIFPHKNIF
jgi:hypothetical protein